MKTLSTALILYFLCCLNLVYSAQEVKIIKMRGDVRIRRGLDETWERASRGMTLKVIDSILILEGEVQLKIHDGLTFRLSSNSMLDIADLRKITKKEMFLFLMAEKVDKLPKRTGKTQLEIGNVSVVHGESKAKSSVKTNPDVRRQWQQELNGAKALLNQHHYPNAIVKLHKIHKKYSSIDDFGEVYFYLGKSFEQIDESGQAIDAYQTAIELSHSSADPRIQQLRSEAEKALQFLVK